MLWSHETPAHHASGPALLALAHRDTVREVGIEAPLKFEGKTIKTHGRNWSPGAMRVICIHISSYTHTHTHTYIYIYIYMYILMAHGTHSRNSRFSSNQQYSEHPCNFKLRAINLGPDPEQAQYRMHDINHVH